MSNFICENLLGPIRDNTPNSRLMSFREKYIEVELYRIFNDRIERTIDVNLFNCISPHKQKANEE